MIRPSEQDDLYRVKDQEQHVHDVFKGEIAHLDRLISLAKSLLSIRNQPGYQEFVSRLVKLKEAESAKLLACVDDNNRMRMIQGRAQALSDILGIVEDTEKNLKGLDARRKAVKNEYEAHLTPDGNVIPDPLGVLK